MADINRSAISLPSEVSSEILQKTQEQSAIMQLSRQITLPGRGITVPVITGDPAAEWVAETAKKPVSNPTVTTKLITPYKLAVIETFSDEFARDSQNLYDALVARLPGALAAKFDNTVAGGTTAPGDNFDQLSKATAVPITAATAYTQLVTTDANIAEAGFILNGFVLSPAAKAILLTATDDNKRPLFINSVAEGAIPRILGVPTYTNKGIKTETVLGIAGDWTQAVYGTVEGIQITVSDQATVGDINLWQQNMIAVRAEMEIGFRADLTAFNVLSAATVA